MIIKEFTIENYRCFLKPLTIKFESGFNVIVGKNNVGKSALVRALSLKYENSPHMSGITMPMPGDRPSGVTCIRVKYEVTKEEFAKTLLVRGQEFCFPLPLLQGNMTPESAMKRIFLKRQWQFKSSFAQNINPPTTECVDFDVYNSTSSIDGNGLCISVRDDLSYVGHAEENRGKDGTYSFARFFSSKLQESIHVLDAVRAHSISQNQATRGYLESDAANLPHEIRNLQRTQTDRQRYNDAVHTVFPDLGLVTFADTSGNIPHIMVHQFGLDDRREDLAIQHTECGTGIGQVLAILHTVVTSKVPRIVIIDEPNSFLHPGALRSLIGVLKEYPQHQYILTTHSPALVASCDPATLTLIEQTDGVSDFKQLDARQREDQSLVLAEVGADFSDVFGTDNILWVEGQTEEKAFPLIIKHVEIMTSLSFKILRVASPADFIKNRSRAISDIYQRLSEGDCLMPQTINFLLDAETTTEKERSDRKEMVPILHFLPRRMYENYLLHPEAIAWVANSTKKLVDKQIDASKVQEWFNLHHKDKKYYRGLSSVRDDWHEDIDGANFLIDMFEEFYDRKHDYKKTRDSVALTKWLLENEPVALQEVADLLRQILNPLQPTS